MGAVDPRAFAKEWIAAWNSHDIERILSHYEEGIVFLSPIAQSRLGDGRVIGLNALRAYWSAGLKLQPELKFDLIDVFVGHECLSILYCNHKGRRVVETVELNAVGKVVRSCACYAEAT